MGSKICLLEPTLGGGLAGHAAYARDLANWITKEHMETVTICCRRDISPSVIKFTGETHRYLRVFSHPFQDWSVFEDPAANWRSREQLTREMIAAIEATHHHDLQVCATAFPNFVYAALKARRRAKRVNFLFHYSLQEHSDSHLMTQPTILKKLQNPRDFGVYCLANNLSLAADLNELGIPTRTVPYIHYAKGSRSLSTRTQAGSLHVGIFGHQRSVKDGGLLIPLCHSLLEQGHKVTFHDSSGTPAPFTHPNLTFVSGFLEPMVFSQLTSTVDLTIITNIAKGFDRAISGVCIESLANGVPCLVPANTHMSRLIHKFNAGATYNQRSVKSITEGISALSTRYANAADGALLASKWLKHYGHGGANAYFDSLCQH